MKTSEQSNRIKNIILDDKNQNCDKILKMISSDLRIVLTNYMEIIRINSQYEINEEIYDITIKIQAKNIRKILNF